jgi:hypothetical protein
MPAPMKWRKKVLLLKIEVTYGTDPTPTGAANALLVSNCVIRPLSDKVTRNNVQPYLGNRQQLIAGLHYSLEFDVELAGSGAAGTAPGFGPALRACGHAETIVASTSVAYAPVSEGEESATIHYHLDGQKHAIVGCRGSVEIRLNAKQIPILHFACMGLYVGPAAAADPTPTLSGFQLPKTVGDANTPTFTLHSYAGKLASLVLRQGNSVVHRELVGEDSVQITDRQSAGTIVIEDPPIGTQDFYAAAAASTLAALQVVHGTAAGNIVTLDAPQAQCLDPDKTEQDSVSMLSMGLVLVPTSAGDDEYTLTFT